MVFLFFSLQFHGLHAREGITLKFYNQKDGLSSNIVNCIYQDSRGFLWIGTIDGLNRFDGKNFKVYKNDPFDTTTISNNEITSIDEDKDSNLWIGTNEGLNLYHWKTDNFTTFRNQSDNENSISYNWIRDIFLDSKGNFWIGTKEGLNLLQNENGKFFFKRYYPSIIDSTTFESPSILSITEDDMGDLWVGTWGGGLCYFNRKTEEFQHFMNTPGDPYSIKNNIVEELGVLDNGMMLTATSDGFCLFDPLKRRFYHKNRFPEFTDLFDIKAPIYSISKSQNGITWIGTANGLLGYHQDKKKIVYNGGLNNPSQAPGELPLDQARCTYIDNTGILWTGIAKTGLGKYDPYENKFLPHRVIIKSPKKYRDYITSIKFVGNNGIWLGTSDDGLVKIDSTGNVITRLTKGKGSSGLSSNMVRSMSFDSVGRLWIASPNGIDIIDPAKETILKRLKHDPNKNSLLHSEIIYLYPDEGGKMWIISRKGIQLYNYLNNTFVDDPLPDMDLIIISKIFKDNDGVYWITGKNKLASYSPSTNKIRYYTSKNKDDKNYISNNEVLSLLQDSKGFMWLGTKSGLNKYDRSNAHVKTYTKKDGISGEVIHQIIEDNSGNVWFSTFTGITKYNRREDYFINFYPEDGLPSIFHGLTKLNDGRIAILDEKQLYIFDPRTIKENKKIPPVYFTSISINGQEITIGDRNILNNSPITANQINLKNQHELILIKAVTLNYTLPEKNQYAYKLMDHDTNWHYLNTNNEITLMNLKPGKYKLKVIGSNNDNHWNYQGAVLDINMSPPWFRTRWAYLIYVLVISSLLMFLRWYYQSREKIKRQIETARLEAEKKYELEMIEKQKEHELDQAKIRFFYDVSHEIRTPLTLISGPLQKLMDDLDFNPGKENLNIILRNTERLKELINQLLDISKLEKGQMQPNYSSVSLQEMLNSIATSFQKVFEEKNINLNKELLLDNRKYYLDKDKTLKVISNLLSNASKFTNPGKRVTIKASIVLNAGDSYKTGNLEKYVPIFCSGQRAYQECLRVEVEDEGVGIPEPEITKIFTRFYQVKNEKKSKPHGTGIGLALTKDLVEKLKGDIFIKSETGRGTSIVIFLPLKLVKNEMQGHTYPRKKLNNNESGDPLEIRPHPEKFILEDEKMVTEETKKPMVLIVEDNRDLLKFMESILNAKYIIKAATNGMEGIEKARKYIPDLIISDIMMPVMDGYDFCMNIKKEKRLFDIPIIVLTAKDGNNNIKDFMKIGIDDYIVKPFHNDLLISRIENLIHKRTALKSIYKQKVNFVDDKQLTNREDEFLQVAIATVEENLANHEFDKREFAIKMNVSKSQLYKKLQQLTGLSPNEFVRVIRLKKAAYILSKSSNLQIAEIGFMVGFSDPNYFSRKFKDYFGTTPTKYSKQNKKEFS